MYNMLKPSHSLKVCVSQKKASAHLCLLECKVTYFLAERQIFWVLYN